MCHGSNCNYAAIKSCFRANKMCTRYLHIYHSQFASNQLKKIWHLSLYSPQCFEVLWFNGYGWITHKKLYINQDILLLLFPVVVSQYRECDGFGCHFRCYKFNLVMRHSFEMVRWHTSWVLSDHCSFLCWIFFPYNRIRQRKKKVFRQKTHRWKKKKKHIQKCSER